MTYKKPLKGFQGTTLMGFTANAMDTADGKRIGSYAIDALEAHETIETEDRDKKILVPFHAVKKAQYGISTADAERPDPYCGGGDDGKTVTVIFDTSLTAGVHKIVVDGVEYDSPYEMNVPVGSIITLPSFTSAGSYPCAYWTKNGQVGGERYNFGDQYEVTESTFFLAPRCDT